MISRLGFVALVCSALFVIGALSGSVAGTGETTVELEPFDRTIESGAVGTYDVVVTNATGGVGSFDLVVTVEDSSIATVSNVSHVGRATYDHQTREKTSAHLAATGMNRPNGSSVHVATISLEAGAAGTTPVTVSVSDVADRSGRSYDVVRTQGGTLTVPTSNDDAGGGSVAGNDASNSDGENTTGVNGDGVSDDGAADRTDRSDTSGDEYDGGNDVHNQSGEEPPENSTSKTDQAARGSDGLGPVILPIIVAAVVIVALSVSVYVKRD